MRRLAIAISLALAGCELVGEASPEPERPISKASMSTYTLHDYVGNLTSQLSLAPEASKGNIRLAVTTFYSTQSLGKKLADQQGAGLSQQVQESLLTQLTQAGYQTIEHRLSRTLNISDVGESILSRDVGLLRSRPNIDLIVTGTITRQEHAYIVNARLINVDDGKILSAAHTEIPINTMWSGEAVQQREGKLYRAQY